MRRLSIARTGQVPGNLTGGGIDRQRNQPRSGRIISIRSAGPDQAEGTIHHDHRDRRRGLGRCFSGSQRRYNCLCRSEGQRGFASFGQRNGGCGGLGCCGGLL